MEKTLMAISMVKGVALQPRGPQVELVTMGQLCKRHLAGLATPI